MKKFLSMLQPLILGSIIGFTGCSREVNVTQVGLLTDEEALKDQVSRIDTAITEFSSSDEATIDDNGMKNPEYDGMMTMNSDEINRSIAIADSIYPVRWGRRMHWNQVIRDYHVVMQGDTIAIVTITKTIPGEFRVGWGTRTPDTTIVDTIIRKPFTEIVKRMVKFKRIRHTDNPHRNWVPVAITMVQGKTENGNKFSITSLEVSESQVPYSATFTDPLDSWFRLGLFRSSMPVFPTRDTITVRLTISSSDSDAEIVHLRHGVGGGRDERRRSLMPLLSATGSAGSYTRVYEKTFFTGLPRWARLAARFNAMVDVISKSSIYDTAAPFTNEYWGMPYIVVR